MFYLFFAKYLKLKVDGKRLLKTKNCYSCPRFSANFNGAILVHEYALI